MAWQPCTGPAINEDQLGMAYVPLILDCVQAVHDAVQAVSANGRSRPTTRELTEVIPYLDHTQTLLGESPEATSAAFSTCELRLEGGLLWGPQRRSRHPC
jgi:hypothetical protein